MRSFLSPKERNCSLTLEKHYKTLTLTHHRHEKRYLRGQKRQVYIHSLCLKGSNLGLIVVAWVVISIGYNNILFTKLTSETPPRLNQTG